MRTGEAVILGLSISVLTILSLGYFLSPQISFSTRNPRWNGHSKLESVHRPTEVESLNDLRTRVSRPAGSVLLILGPARSFSREEAGKVQEFVEKGGRLVLADDFGSGNDLLERMDVDVRFSKALLRDPIFKIRESRVLKIFELKGSHLVEDVSSIAFNSATVFSGTASDCGILARSSESSYVGENRLGPFPVICRLKRGEGEVVLISDSSVFINTMLGRENNRELLGNLIGERKVYLDTSHWNKSTFMKFQEVLFEVYGIMDRIEIKYGLLILLTAFIFKVGWGKRKKESDKKDGKVKEVLKRHPEWDRDTLKKLEEERES